MSLLADGRPGGDASGYGDGGQGPQVAGWRGDEEVLFGGGLAIKVRIGKSVIALRGSK